MSAASPFDWGSVGEVIGIVCAANVICRGANGSGHEGARSIFWIAVAVYGLPPPVRWPLCGECLERLALAVELSHQRDHLRAVLKIEAAADGEIASLLTLRQIVGQQS